MAKLLIKKIDDGYTFTGVVEPIGPWPAVTIKYRPALPDRAQDFFDETSRPKSRAEGVVKLLAEHVKSWDVEDDDGKPAAVDAEALRRVPYPVREKMVDLVIGYSGKADEKN